MTLPNLEQKTKKGDIQEGVILYSSVTEIYYKKVKGVLMRYSAYGGAERGWVTSAYSGDFKHMKPATDKQIKELV